MHKRSAGASPLGAPLSCGAGPGWGPRNQDEAGAAKCPPGASTGRRCPGTLERPAHSHARRCLPDPSGVQVCTSPLCLLPTRPSQTLAATAPRPVGHPGHLHGGQRAPDTVPQALGCALPPPRSWAWHRMPFERRDVGAQCRAPAPLPGRYSPHRFSRNCCSCPHTRQGLVRRRGARPVLLPLFSPTPDTAKGGTSLWGSQAGWGWRRGPRMVRGPIGGGPAGHTQTPRAPSLAPGSRHVWEIRPGPASRLAVFLQQTGHARDPGTHCRAPFPRVSPGRPVCRRTSLSHGPSTHTQHTRSAPWDKNLHKGAFRKIKYTRLFEGDTRVRCKAMLGVDSGLWAPHTVRHLAESSSWKGEGATWEKSEDKWTGSASCPLGSRSRASDVLRGPVISPADDILRELLSHCPVLHAPPPPAAAPPLP